MSKPGPPSDPFPYPEGALMGLASSADMAERAIGALTATGVADRRITVLEGEEGARLIDPMGEGHGVAGARQRLVQTFAGNENTLAAEYAGRLRDGNELVVVYVDDRDEAVAFSRDLHEAGLDAVRYFAKYVIEDL